MTLLPFPASKLNALKTDSQLSDSGLTASWLLDTLWERCPEFREALGSGTVHEVWHISVETGTPKRPALPRAASLGFKVKCFLLFRIFSPHQFTFRLCSKEAASGTKAKQCAANE